MNLKSILKNNLSAYLLLFFIMVFFSFFVNIKSVSAATNPAKCWTIRQNSSAIAVPEYASYPEATSSEKCQEEATKLEEKCKANLPKNESPNERCGIKIKMFDEEKTIIEVNKWRYGTTEGNSFNSALTKQKQEGREKDQDAMSGNIFVQGINWLLRQILAGMGILLSLAGTIFAWIAKAKNVTDVLTNEGVYQMWAFVRDILNVAFILVLVFSAFATIFQVSKFNYKNTLLTLVIMALLVNFSYPITMFIIDASNVAMFSLMGNFFDADTSKIFVNIADKSGIGGILTAGETSQSSSFLIFAIIFLFMLAVTFLSVGVLFVIRTIALAVLVIFSPLAFVGAIIPGASGKASQWWDQLFKYALFGPIMMLMLVIASKVMATLGSINFSPEATKNSPDPSIIASMSQFVIPMVILWMGMGVAQSMSVAGAGAVMGQAQKFMKWSGRNLTGYNLAKVGVKAGVGKIERELASTKYGKFLVPRVYKEAWKQRAAIKDREAFEGSTGQMHDLFNKTLSFGKEKTDFAFASHQGKVSKYAKEISDVSTNADYVIKELERAISNKQVAKVEGALKVLAQENNLNDMMAAIGDKYGMKKKVAGPLYFKAAMRDMLSQAGAGANVDENEFIAKELLNLSEIGVGAGNIGMAGMSKFDADKGIFRTTSDQEQAEAAAAKFQNFEPQQRQRILHHNSVLGEDHEGNVASIDLVQQAILSRFNEGDVEQMNRNRADLRRQIKKAATDTGISEEARRTFVNLLNQNKFLNTYAETVAAGLAKPKEKKA